jgi:hypothetical protein
VLPAGENADDGTVEDADGSVKLTGLTGFVDLLAGDAIRTSASRYGEQLRRKRIDGQLRVAPTRLITTTTTGARLRDHTFYHGVDRAGAGRAQRAACGGSRAGRRGGDLRIRHRIRRGRSSPHEQLTRRLADTLPAALDAEERALPAHFEAGAILTALTWWLDNPTTFSAAQVPARVGPAHRPGRAGRHPRN